MILLIIGLALLVLSRVLARRAGADTAGIAVRPPLLVLGLIFVGLGLEALWPSRPLPGRWHVLIGPLTVGGAVALFALAVRELRAAGTPVQASRPTTALVRRGPYRHTRNPIYVAFVVLGLGIALWANSLWVLAMVIPLVAVLRWGVIAREEAYLERRIGDEYRQYSASVRRWL